MSETSYPPSRFGTLALTSIGLYLTFITLAIIAGITGIESRAEELHPATIIIVLAFMFCLIGGYITYNMALYGMWKQIQDGDSRMSPSLAVILNFVPLLNIIWPMFSFYGLSRDLNRYTRQMGIEAPRAREGLCLTACILLLFSWIPFLGYMVAPFSFGFWAFGLWSLAGTSSEIAAWKLGSDRGEFGADDGGGQPFERPQQFE